MIEVIVCYDIHNNKTRRKFREALLNFGLTNIQESVYWGRVLPAEVKALTFLFKTHLNKKTDKAFIVKTKLSETITEYSFGYPNAEDFQDKNYAIV